MPNNYKILDHLHEMHEAISNERLDAYRVSRLISSMLEIKDLARAEISPRFIEENAEALAKLYYGVQTAHSEVKYRFMSKDEANTLRLAIAANVLDWIGYFEAQVTVINELPKAQVIYTTDDLTWVGVRSKYWESLPEFLKAKDYKGKTSQYLVLPGVFAVSHNQHGAYFTELVTGYGKALHDTNRGREVTKDRLGGLIVRIANQMDWPTWIKQIEDAETFYYPRELRTKAYDFFAWSFVDQYNKEAKVNDEL